MMHQFCPNTACARINIPNEPSRLCKHQPAMLLARLHFSKIVPRSTPCVAFLPLTVSREVEGDRRVERAGNGYQWLYIFDLMRLRIKGEGAVAVAVCCSRSVVYGMGMLFFQ